MLFRSAPHAAGLAVRPIAEFDGVNAALDGAVDLVRHLGAVIAAHRRRARDLPALDIDGPAALGALDAGGAEVLLGLSGGVGSQEESVSA